MTEHTSIYLDESGDLGFNFSNKGTPRYFIITLLTCHNGDTVEHIKKSVRRTLKNKLQTKKRRPIELKGTETTIAIKNYFYRHLSKSNDWTLHSIILDKHKLANSLSYLPSEHRLYNYLSKEILKELDLNTINTGLLLTVDKRKGRKRINEFNRYLSNHLEAMLPLQVTYDISHEQSHENLVLQAVDLFCWGVRRLYEYGDDVWYNVYKDRVNLMELTSFLGIKKDGP